MDNERLLDLERHSIVQGMLERFASHDAVIMPGIDIEPDGTYKAFIATGPMLETRYILTYKRI